MKKRYNLQARTVSMNDKTTRFFDERIMIRTGSF